MKTIYGELIRKQRESERMTLSELSDRCLIREKYLRQAEKGEQVLSHADLVLICNALDISSVALAEGRLVKKPGVPELEELIRKLEHKMEELRESIQEMKEAAAVLTGTVPDKVPEKCTVIENAAEAPETIIVQAVPGKEKPLGPVI